MGNMMVIVSKAIFEKAKNSNGKKLSVGDLYDTKVYISKSKAILKKLDGDLFLITVQNGELWLIAHLCNPEHDGSQWNCEHNKISITNLTPVAGDIRFNNDKGINLEKMAMSLQTPRVLSDDDVELLLSQTTTEVTKTRKKKTDKIDNKGLEKVVVSILSKILGRSEKSIRSDKNQYAAYHWDDGFLDMYGDEINWKKGTFKGAENDECWFWGRSDFDDKTSLIKDEGLEDYAFMDPKMVKFSKAQSSFFYFSQASELFLDGRFEVDYPSFIGRIKSGPSLVSVATHLFCLHKPIVPFNDENYEVDGEWVEMISTISDSILQKHLGTFFQDADTARCFGAYFAGSLQGIILSFENFENIATWDIGEGQGMFSIVKVLDNTIATLPPVSEMETDPNNPLVQLKIANSRGKISVRMEAFANLIENFDALPDVLKRDALLAISRDHSPRQAKRLLPILREADALCRIHFPDDIHALKTVRFQFALLTDIRKNREEAIELYTELIELVPHESVYWFNRACEYGILGKAAESVSDLEKANSIMSYWGNQAKKEEYFDPIRGSSEFKIFMEKIS